MSRATYGVMCKIDFNKEDPEHLKRSAGIFLDDDGMHKIPGRFCAVLERVSTNLDCNL